MAAETVAPHDIDNNLGRWYCYILDPPSLPYLPTSIVTPDNFVPPNLDRVRGLSYGRFKLSRG